MVLVDAEAKAQQAVLVEMAVLEGKYLLPILGISTTRIGHAESGGNPGQGGERGPKGIGGLSGAGGAGGDPATTYNCSISTPHLGNPGGVKPPLGNGTLGLPGNNGTIAGPPGAWHPNRLDTPHVAGGCNGSLDYGQYPGSGCALGFTYYGGIAPAARRLPINAIGMAVTTRIRAIARAGATRVWADVRRWWSMCLATGSTLPILRMV